MERLSGLRAVVVGGCAVAGVVVLAGPGWGLLAAAAVLWVMPAPAVARAWAGRAAGWVRGLGGPVRRWVAGGRRAVAVASAPAAMLLIPLGVGVSLGLGASLVAAGVMLGGLSMISGWNA